MNQTTTSNTQPVDVEALRLQLEEDGKVYCDNNSDLFYCDFRNRNPREARERLLHTLQTNDCRGIITAIVDGDVLAGVFVLAANEDHVDILEEFLNHGMNVNIKDENDYTALIEASYNGHEQCVQFLLDHNASVDLQDINGWTALMFASQSRHTKIVDMLLEKNANPDIQDMNGKTALMRASSECHEEAVQLLLNHNADIELKNNKGKTALDHAGNDGIKEMLRNHVSTCYVLK